MTKAEICADIAQKTGVEKSTVVDVVDEFFKTLRKNMIEGKNIFFRGFGSFVIHKRSTKIARNISKNTAMTIPAHNIVKFIPSKEFNKAVGKHNPVKE
jgi:DNA-binding protein HU-beta